MSEPALLVFVTAPSEVAGDLAHALVERRLCACASLLPAVTSVYRWEGKVEQASEVLMLLKTTSSRYSDLQAAVQELHPYQVPEVIAVPLSAGLPAYLQWLADSVSPQE